VADLIPIEVMISSAVNEKVGATALGEIRDRIAQRLRATQVAQKSVVRVWLSEQQGALSQDASTWDTCVAEARRCDIFVGLYTGNAGWVRDHLGIGICHAEWQEAFQATPTKTRIVPGAGRPIAGSAFLRRPG
jgi:hypothetical protein